MRRDEIRQRRVIRYVRRGGHSCCCCCCAERRLAKHIDTTQRSVADNTNIVELLTSECQHWLFGRRSVSPSLYQTVTYTECVRVPYTSTYMCEYGIRDVIKFVTCNKGIKMKCDFICNSAVKPEKLAIHTV